MPLPANPPPAAQGARPATAIDRTIQERIAAHQSMIAAAAPGAHRLNLLADGDSWFDYPLSGEGILIPSDIIVQLRRSVTPYILDLAHYGDATTHRSEFDGIGEQIPCHLLQAIRIATNECAGGRKCVDDLNSFGLSCGPHNIERCLDHGVQIDPAKIEPQLASDNARHVQYVFDQLDLSLCIPVYNLNRAPGRFIV